MSKVLFVRMDADEYERLRTAALADDRTISQAVRVAIRSYLGSRAENAALRDELERQWGNAHASQCDNWWPHPDGDECSWPKPALLGHLPPTQEPTT